MRNALAVMLALTAPAAAAPPRAVKIKTADGWTLAALYRPPAKGKPVAVLIHGVAAGKGEWTAFSDELAAQGYGTLAFDLRGHGESVDGPKGRRTYESFRTEDFAAAQADLTAALRFLKGKRLPAKRIGVIGGSLGANLAAHAESAAWAVLLSPGADYMGVHLPEDWTGRRVLAAASPGDQYAFRTCLSLAARADGPAFLRGQNGHGAQLLKDEGFREKLLEWLAQTPKD